MRPPEDSKHVKRAKYVWRGTCSRTGNPVHYYEKDGYRVRISADEFPKWHKVFK
jgi:hypothetical protein